MAAVMLARMASALSYAKSDAPSWRAMSVGARQTGWASPGASLIGTDALDTTLCVRVGSLALNSGSGGDEDVCQRGQLIVNDKSLNDQELEAAKGGEEAGAAVIAKIGGNVARPVESGNFAGFDAVSNLIEAGCVRAEDVRDALRVAAAGAQHVESAALPVRDVAGEGGNGGDQGCQALRVILPRAVDEGGGGGRADDAGCPAEIIGGDAGLRGGVLNGCGGKAL